MTAAFRAPGVRPVSLGPPMNLELVRAAGDEGEHAVQGRADLSQELGALGRGRRQDAAGRRSRVDDGEGCVMGCHGADTPPSRSVRVKRRRSAQPRQPGHLAGPVAQPAHRPPVGQRHAPHEDHQKQKKTGLIRFFTILPKR